MPFVVYLQADSLAYVQNASSPNWPPERCLFLSIPKDKRLSLFGVAYFVFLPLDTLLAVMSLICNSVVLASILRTRRIQRPSLILLCSLSMTDLTWAVFALYKNIQALTSKDICPKEPKGRVEWCTYLICGLSTLGNLAVISLDRFLALSKPLWYRTSVTRSRAIKQVLFVWLLSGISVGIAAESHSFPSLEFLEQWIILFWYVACSSTIICCYIGTLIANRRHRVAMVQYNGEMHATITREKRVANTVGLILMALCFTLLPAMLTPVVLLTLGYSRNTNPLRLFYAILITLNSLLNPLLNYGRNEEVRMAVRMTIRCQCLSRDQQHSRLDDNRQRRINLSTLRVNNRVTNLPPVRQQPSNSGAHQVSITNL